jgi:hypothetical protein
VFRTIKSAKTVKSLEKGINLYAAQDNCTFSAFPATKNFRCAITTPNSNKTASSAPIISATSTIPDPADSDSPTPAILSPLLNLCYSNSSLLPIKSRLISSEGTKSKGKYSSITWRAIKLPPTRFLN